MKVQIEIDCTPQEAREFLGLPDLAAMQKRMGEGLEERIREALAGLDAQALLKMWLPGGVPGGMPGGMKGFEDLQKAFWEGLAKGGQDSSS